MKTFLRCLIAMLIVFLLILMLTVGRFVFLLNEEYGPPLHQPQEEIKEIQLLDTHDYKEIVLYQLCSSEITQFMIHFQRISFYRILNDPPGWYGPIAVKITYSDGGIDIIGTEDNTHYNGDGSYYTTGYFSVEDEMALFNLFAQYVSADLLPSEMG